MSFRLPLTRRRLLACLASTALSTTLASRIAASPNDQGIGGTGAAPDTDTSDRGIGGTGVIGTIRKFGSIIVNDMRIAYPPDAEIRIDGAPARVADLKIGQVVRVAASGAPDKLSTRAIDVTSEVVGPVEKIDAKEIRVLGQTVSTAALKQSGIKVGDTVAVSGLRRNDGTIVASLIEARPGAPSRLAGPVRLDADGAVRIGGLALSGVDGSLVDRRVLLDGAVQGDRFVVTHGVPEAALLPPDIHNLSIESYVERKGDHLSLGSGFSVSHGHAGDFPSGRSVRAVLSTSLGANGELTLDHLKANGRTYDVSGRGAKDRTKGGGKSDERGGRGIEHGSRGTDRGTGKALDGHDRGRPQELPEADHADRPSGFTPRGPEQEGPGGFGGFGGGPPGFMGGPGPGGGGFRR